jgi:hypothetical protein
MKGLLKSIGYIGMIILILCQCWSHSEAQSSKELIVGSWKHVSGIKFMTNDEIIEFKKDGNFIIFIGTFNIGHGTADSSLSVPGKWSMIDINKVKIMFPPSPMGGQGKEYTLNITIKGKILTLETTATYKKIE